MAIEPYFVEFTFSDEQQFTRIRRVFEVLKEDKKRSAFRPLREYLALFDAQAQDYFWWPAGWAPADAVAAWEQQERTVPLVERQPGQGVPLSGWRLDSLIDYFDACDFDLLACRRTATDRARLEFVTGGWPYGGTAALWVLIEAFGGHVVREDDGFGVREV